MTISPLARNLVRKSKRAMLSAKVGLQVGDADNAVNRSYYAMFDIARAALLSEGVPEDKLPRTHNGVIGAFWHHAIDNGKIDPALASALSRAEGLRLLADYTDTEISVGAATDAVSQAEKFVDTVGRVYALDEAYVDEKLATKGSEDGKVSEPDIDKESIQPKELRANRYSLQDAQRQSRENWLRLREQLARAPESERKERDLGHDVEES
jgi:uncharacterized protein